MVSFEGFSAEGGVPIYLQIVMYVKRGAVSGAVADGDELPSRRVLSALLGVNPNTVQKAYRMLEDEGLVQSRSGAKSCMVLDAEKISRIRSELTEHDVRAAVTAMKQMGLTREEAKRLIDEYWG